MLRLVFRFLLVVLVCCGTGYVGWRFWNTKPPIERAEGLLHSGDVFGAQTLLRGLIKSEPRNMAAHLLLARTQITTSDWVSVEKEARILRNLGAERSATLPLLVRSYAMQGRFQDILADVPAVAARPEEQALNMALRSVAFLGLGDLAQAQSVLDAAAKLAPGEFLVHLQRARLALVRKEEAQALQSAEAAVALRPESTQALETLSEARAAHWDTFGAITALNEAVDLQPWSQELRLARIRLLMGLGLDGQAQADVNAIFQITSSNATALFYNALLLFRAGQLADASVEFDALGPKMDQFPRAYLYKAQIALQLGNKTMAMENLDRLFRVQPRDPEALRLTAEAELAVGRPERALAVLAPVTVPELRDATAQDLRGRALFMLGRMPEAVASFRLATEIAPSNQSFASHLAAAQTRFGDAPAPVDAAAGPLP